MESKKRFDDALYGVSPAIRSVLEKLPDKVKESAEEIRLRTGLPVALTVGGDTVFVLENGQISFCLTRGLLKTEASELAESFKLLCKSSVYAHTEELKKGYIRLRGGNRACYSPTCLLHSLHTGIIPRLSGKSRRSGKIFEKAFL